MKALIIYDSIFGNTEKIAEAIAAGLGPGTDVVLVRPADVQPGDMAGIDLLLVGSPTRAFKPTPAIRDLVRGIPRGALAGVKVAGFDTRIPAEEAGSPVLRIFVKVFGYAAKPISDGLQKAGGQVVAPPEGFAVKGSEGPLKAGELERATAWARQIAAA